MSLHIGRLSSDVRQRYLEHLFQNFGPCTVNLKDGYGFAVYDANDHAARALQQLHGKFVCGKRITVNWSKQQPRFSRSVRRSSRFIESSHGRKSRDGVDNFRFRDSAGQKNHPARHYQSHIPDDAAEKKSDEVGESLKDSGENKSDEIAEGSMDAGENTDKDPEEMKMDEDSTSDPKAIDHDRWGETGEGDLGGEGDNFDRYEPYHGSGKQEETEKIIKASSSDFRDHRRSSKKWQEYPAEHFDLNHDKSKSLPACYNCGTAGHIARNCPEETVGKVKALRDRLSMREKCEHRLRRFRSPPIRRPEFLVDPMIQAHHRVQDNRKPFSDKTGNVPRLSYASRVNRRHTPQIENMPQAPKEAHNGNKSKRSFGPFLSSDRTSSNSRSRSSHSRSRAHSPSHSAHSSSKSSQPTQPEGLRLGSSSNMNYPGQLSVPVSPQCDSPHAAVDKNLDVLVNSVSESNLDSKARSEFKHMDDYKQQVKGSRLNSVVPITSSKLDTLSNGELHVPGKDVKVSGHTENNLDKDLVSDEIVAVGERGQKTRPEYTSSVKSNKETLVKNGRSNSLKLTTTEVVSALKHYGMAAREMDLSDRPGEKYFGAARLWPWEIIYYRRRKKGPISTENYAKRLEQNNEFGIIDKYVRSSSGWWECR